MLVSLAGALALTPMGTASSQGGGGRPESDPLADHDSPAFRALQEAAQAGTVEMQRRRRERGTPEAKAARMKSRKKFKDLQAPQVLPVLREHFPQSVAKPPRKALKGRDVVGLVTPWLARVNENGDERGTAVLSALGPLAVPDADGDLAPVDLELVDAGGYLRPRRGGVRLRLPERLGSGIELGDDVVLRPRSGAADERPATLEGSAVYVNSDTDTDTVARPLTGGVELSEVLRSDEAPERFTLDVDGSNLRLSPSKEPGGGFDVLRGDERVAWISDARANDADGEPVPVSTQATGTSLVMKIEHRGADVRYPIELDPVVSDSWNWETMDWAGDTGANKGGAYDGRAGWQFQADYADRLSNWAGDGWLGRGWHIDYNAGTQYFDWNKYAYMRYFPPGDTRITQARLEASYAAAAGNNGCLFGGIQGYRPSDGVADCEDRADWCGDARPDVCCGEEQLDISRTYTASKGFNWPTVLSGTFMYQAQNRWRFHVQTGVADITLEDSKAPTISTDWSGPRFADT